MEVGRSSPIRVHVGEDDGARFAGAAECGALKASGWEPRRCLSSTGVWGKEVWGDEEAQKLFACGWVASGLGGQNLSGTVMSYFWILPFDDRDLCLAPLSAGLGRGEGDFPLRSSRVSGIWCALGWSEGNWPSHGSAAPGGLSLLPATPHSLSFALWLSWCWHWGGQTHRILPQPQGCPAGQGTEPRRANQAPRSGDTAWGCLAPG